MCNVENISTQPHDLIFGSIFGMLRPLALKTPGLKHVVNTRCAQSQNTLLISLTAKNKKGFLMQHNLAQMCQTSCERLIENVLLNQATLT